MGFGFRVLGLGVHDTYIGSLNQHAVAKAWVTSSGVKGLGTRVAVPLEMGVSRTLLGVPIIRIIVLWGLNWGPFILGNYKFVPGRNIQSEGFGVGCC